METKKRYLGKKIQISSSKVGIQLAQKLAPRFGTDYESVFISGHSLLSSLARQTECNVEKVEFMDKVYSLGKVAGGEDTLNYINSKIDSTREKITEKDIMFQNLQNVFPNLEQSFTEEELIEFSQLYSEKNDLKEAIIVKLSHDLNLLLQYYKNTNNYKNGDIIKYIYNKVKEFANRYKANGELLFDEQTKNDLLTLKSRKVDFDLDEQEYLNTCAQNYNNFGEKHKLIEELNDFRIKLEKKTKIR